MSTYEILRILRQNSKRISISKETFDERHSYNHKYGWNFLINPNGSFKMNFSQKTI